MIEQVIIAVTGLIAIWLTQDEGQNRKYACLFGLAGQPFWVYAAWVAQQWGILILTIFYTLAWLKGIKTYWWKR